MKKTIAALAVLTLSATLAVAGPGGKGGHRGGHDKGEFSARLAEKLNLSEAQKSQARQLHEQFRAENEPFFNSLKQTKADLRAAKEANDTARVDALRAAMKSQKEQFRARRQAQHERFLSILTADQRAQFDAMKAQRGNKHRGEGRQRQ